MCPVNVGDANPRAALSARAMLDAAFSRFLSYAPTILLLLVGWVGVWFVVEFLVISFSPIPGRPVWILLHASYFLATAVWEAAMLATALKAFNGKRSFPRRVLLDYRLALRLFVVKMILLPAVLVGLGLALAPGLYVLARFGLAPFFLVDRACSPWTALRLSNRVSRGHRSKLMALYLVLLLLTLLGAAFFGVGLFVTIPMALLAAAHIFVVVRTPASSQSSWVGARNRQDRCRVARRDEDSSRAGKTEGR